MEIRTERQTYHVRRQAQTALFVILLLCSARLPLGLYRHFKFSQPLSPVQLQPTLCSTVKLALQKLSEKGYNCCATGLTTCILALDVKRPHPRSSKRGLLLLVLSAQGLSQEPALP